MDYFASLAALEKELLARKVTIFYHQYHHLAFGSWVLELGRPHERLRFIWDGRDGVLEVSKSEFGTLSDPPDWKPVRSLDIGEGDVTAVILDNVESLLG